MRIWEFDLQLCYAGLLRVGAWTLAAVVFPGFLSGQTVRGTVTERSSGAPGIGAIVILERLAQDSVVERNAVLAHANGSFIVRATAPGTHRLTVRRIGSTPFQSELFQLAAGEERRFDVELDQASPTGSSMMILSGIEGWH